ncbi:hypothetical protein BDA96_05G173500, partial [Sorghum bicolor]
MGHRKLDDTLTNVVIPAFDTRWLKTRIFSSFKSQIGISTNKPLLSDVCIATTAAPTFFPAHYFELFYPYNQAFHVVDGGVGANNPTMVAISNIARHVLCKNDKFGKDLDYSKLIVISVGTGTANEMTLAAREGKYYKAKDCAKWGAIGWIFNDWGRRKPIVDMLMGASDFLVDYYVAMLLQIQNCDRYLRIQALEVDKRHLSLDDASEDNRSKSATTCWRVTCAESTRYRGFTWSTAVSRGQTGKSSRPTPDFSRTSATAALEEGSVARHAPLINRNLQSKLVNRSNPRTYPNPQLSTLLRRPKPTQTTRPNLPHWWWPIEPACIGVYQCFVLR